MRSTYAGQSAGRRLDAGADPVHDREQRAEQLLGVRAAAAAGPSRMVAAMACALTPPGRLLAVEPAGVSAFLRPRPVRELPGVGPTTARLLIQHGVHTVGDLACLPLATVQRLLGARTGRTLHDRAHGHDHRPVVTEPVARSTSAEHRFTRLAFRGRDPVGALYGRVTVGA
ncbi:hypothetical protein OHA57_39200 (plasmid) [Streptomyces anulatus]|uniref:DNA polymerase thumb domain-containing protein n=2 Tax=Streptomyces anulatus TaxID=1892 RepID=UPI002DDA22F0|nr:hypothetical protein [Streptomyces anulatus]WSC66798.1 hypothetical protein OHA57_39200 [Streptomyces anulatus]